MKINVQKISNKDFNKYKNIVMQKIGEVFLRSDLSCQDLLDMDRIMDFIISNKTVERELTGNSKTRRIK